MAEDFKTLDKCRVFLNYPFDEEFEPLAHAMHFAVVAAGLIPRCTRDVSMNDQLRLGTLLETLSSCGFSVHDLSRYQGSGTMNYARLNMPLELGMAIFYCYNTSGDKHRYLFFVPTEYDYQRFISDLSGLDPTIHHSNDMDIMTGVYDWLRNVAGPLENDIPTNTVQEKYKLFKENLKQVIGSGTDNLPTHDEAQELMYRMCADWGWWEWRIGATKKYFPMLPLSFK